MFLTKKPIYNVTHNNNPPVITSLSMDNVEINTEISTDQKVKKLLTISRVASDPVFIGLVLDFVKFKNCTSPSITGIEDYTKLKNVIDDINIIYKNFCT